MHHAHDGLVQVGVVINDDRVLAAHLGDDPLDMVLAGPGVGGLAVDQQADLARAREGDQVDAGMVHQRLADFLAPAGQVVESARR